MKRKERSKTLPEVLLLLAKSKPKNMWQIAKALDKSYGNIHQTMKKLMEFKYVKVEKKRKSRKNPKIEVEYYGVTIRGLVDLLLINTRAWSYIDQIADQHKDKLLIFQKWGLFDKEKLKATIIGNFKDTLVSLVRFKWSERVFFGSARGLTDSALARIIDSMTLGCHYVRGFKKVKHKEEFKSYLAILKVCKRDPELSKFVDAELKFFEQDAHETLSSIREAQKFWEGI